MTHTMSRGSTAASSTTTLPKTKTRATRSSAATSRQTSPTQPSLPEDDSTPVISNTCYNCGVASTPLWRRDAGGNVICNACGLYFKLHAIARPISMKRAVIKRRRRRATNLPAKTLPPPLVVGRSSSLPLSASSVDTSTSQHALPSDGVSDYSPTYSPAAHQQLAPLHRPQIRLPGIESLMRAAELISLPDHTPVVDDALLAQVPRCLDRKRSYSQTSTPSPSALRLMHENLLHSLATVATAEISLSNKRRAIASTPGSAIGSAGQSVPYPYHDEHNFQHTGYREELERECERLAKIEYDSHSSESHAQ
ncbi:GATA type transcriptional activator of nitrogen-regulated proteins [Coemansia aciculifera]|uniref:GATA type transcriptional activator of nitrogen-regulated proteins n=1 Tax=Coemansia aciculifera TaxID=417176 RepID=A0A9W8INJ4_9FUNG|nr:GATA type transcriptional activator of nitrogen-regulated proteins [Coemansia aciculifera]